MKLGIQVLPFLVRITLSMLCMRIDVLFLLWGILIGAIDTIFAQQTPIVYDYTLGIKDGLLENNYLDVITDKRGIVWMASAQGLDRYDGVSIKNYPSKETGFAEKYIDKLALDNKGNIWLRCLPFRGASKVQFSIFNPISEKVMDLKEYLKNENTVDVATLETIYDLNDKQLYLKTSSGGLYQFENYQLNSIGSVKDSSFAPVARVGDWLIISNFLKSPVHCLYWQHTSKGTQSDCISAEYALGLAQIIVPDSSDALYWFTNSLESGIYQMRFFKQKVGQAPVLIAQKELLIDPSDEYHINLDHFSKDEYLLSLNDSLYYFRYNGELTTRISVGRLSAIEFSSHYLLDAAGGIWKANRQVGGIRYINYTSSYFTRYQLYNEWKGIRGIFRKDSILFINPIYELPTKKIKDGPFIKTLLSNSGFIFDDQKGTFWVAHETMGQVYSFNYKGERLKGYFHTETQKSIVNIIAYEDQAGTIWVGSHDGLHYLDQKVDSVRRFHQEKKFEILNTSSIYFFYEKGDNIWLATSSGLYRMDLKNGIQERFHEDGDEAHYLSDNHIAHIHEDAEGLFWLASKGGGLIRFDPKHKTTKQFKQAQGLSNNVVYAVYEDDYNCLWMSSNYGIIRFNKSDYTIDNYSQEHGLLDHEFNTSSHHQDSTGRIYFGSQLGVIVVDPTAFQRQKEEEDFPICISSAVKIEQATGKSINILTDVVYNQLVRVDQNIRGIELTVALLDYRDPSLHQYAYKINGYQKDWIYQKSAIIRENNLPYGRYQLSFKIRNINGDWVESKETIQLLVVRPFYAQWWFYLLVVGLVLCLFFIVLRMRTRQLRKRQLELEKIVKKRTEKIAQQADSLKALDKVKSRFFANITHELRTPLTLILGPLSKLLRMPLDKAVSKSLGTIQRNGQQLLGLIEEILDLSKLEANKLELEENKVPLKRFIDFIFGAFQSQADYQQIEYLLENNIPDDLCLLIDAKKLEKILNNLLSNAIKFTPKGEGIQISVTELEDNIQFVVKDTGQGIHPDDLPYVFDRFYQSKQVDRPAQGGTGIGLSLVYEFTQIMGGEISVESTLNEGTVFYLYLPKQLIDLEDEAESLFYRDVLQGEVMDEEEKWQSIPKDKTILLVEDHSEMRLFVCSLLDSYYNVHVAKNGKEGLEAMDKYASNIDLIISDVMMPEMDGFTMLKHIKAKAKWRSIPMVMLTARAAKEDKLDALTVGVDDYLTKPFSVDELLVRVRNLILNATARKSIVVEDEPRIKDSKEVDEKIVLVSNEELEWMKELEMVIQEKLSEQEVSIANLSKLMFVSERHFRRKIKKITGLTPRGLINEIKMKQARQVLDSNKQTSIRNLAMDLGFSNSSAFARAFKKHFGKSPSEYLKK